MDQFKYDSCFHKKGYQESSSYVKVQGVIFYKTNDELIANAIADNYRTIGWKNVTVIKEWHLIKSK